MRIDEAIHYLDRIKQEYDCSYEEDALNMAIKALEQRPCDAVSRKEVMNMLHNHAFDYATSTKISALLKTMRGEVDRMPSVQPKQEVDE